MYCLRYIFIVVLQELHVHCFTTVFVITLVCSLNSMCIPSFVLIGTCVSEVLFSSLSLS